MLRRETFLEFQNLTSKTHFYAECNHPIDSTTVTKNPQKNLEDKQRLERNNRAGHSSKMMLVTLQLSLKTATC